MLLSTSLLLLVVFNCIFTVEFCFLFTICLFVFVVVVVFRLYKEEKLAVLSLGAVLKAKLLEENVSVTYDIPF